MLSYTLGPTNITITLEEPAPLAVWITHLIPHIRVLHGSDADAAIRQVETLARKILTTEFMTYGETAGGAVLDLKYKELFTDGQPSPQATG
ncbi:MULTISPECIES: hypothetical protein [Nocardia]|uniref:hypothetical protein n=1 Tax=Nocardia TaxID=1817 RepID=UPI001300951D|nr:MULTISPECIES: hypothetical protein [Nocardia]